MGLHRSLIFVLLGAFLSSCFLKGECRYLEGYKFPVYTTEFCPRNQSEWNERSSSIYCNDSIGYMCTPNENITKLIEFCFPSPFTWIQEGICLVLHRRNSEFLSYSCSQFWSGCPSSSYTSDKSFEHPNCTAIGNGCFLAETNCSSTTPGHLRMTTEPLQSANITTYDRKQNVTKYSRKSTEHAENDRLFNFLTISVGILAPICVLFALSIYFRRRIPSQRECEKEIHSEEEINPLIQQEQQIDTRNSSDNLVIALGGKEMKLGSLIIGSSQKLRPLEVHCSKEDFYKLLLIFDSESFRNKAAQLRFTGKLPALTIVLNPSFRDVDDGARYVENFLKDILPTVTSSCQKLKQKVVDSYIKEVLKCFNGDVQGYYDEDDNTCLWFVCEEKNSHLIGKAFDLLAHGDYFEKVSDDPPSHDHDETLITCRLIPLELELCKKFNISETLRAYHGKAIKHISIDEDKCEFKIIVINGGDSVVKKDIQRFLDEKKDTKMAIKKIPKCCINFLKMPVVMKEIGTEVPYYVHVQNDECNPDVYSDTQENANKVVCIIEGLFRQEKVNLKNVDTGSDILKTKVEEWRKELSDMVGIDLTAEHFEIWGLRIYVEKILSQLENECQQHTKASSLELSGKDKSFLTDCYEGEIQFSKEEDVNCLESRAFQNKIVEIQDKHNCLIKLGMEHGYPLENRIPNGWSWYFQSGQRVSFENSEVIALQPNQTSCVVKFLPQTQQTKPGINFHKGNTTHCENALQATIALPVWRDGKNKEKEFLSNCSQLLFLKLRDQNISTIVFELMMDSALQWPEVQVLKSILYWRRHFMDLTVFCHPDKYKYQGLLNFFKELKDEPKREQICIRIEKKRFTDVKVQVLVNTVGRDLILKKGHVSNSILLAAGNKIQMEANEKFPSGSLGGEVLVTDAYKLRDRGILKVFHGSLLPWKDIESIAAIKSFVAKCLCLATEYGLTSIAFPALGTDNLGYEHSTVAAAMFETVRSFMEGSVYTSVKEVVFNVFDDKSIEAFCQEARKYLNKPCASGTFLPRTYRFSYNNLTFELYFGEVWAQDVKGLVVLYESSEIFKKDENICIAECGGLTRNFGGDNTKQQLQSGKLDVVKIKVWRPVEWIFCLTWKYGRELETAGLALKSVEEEKLDSVAFAISKKDGVAGQLKKIIESVFAATKQIRKGSPLRKVIIVVDQPLRSAACKIVEDHRYEMHNIEKKRYRMNFTCNSEFSLHYAKAEVISALDSLKKATLNQNNDGDDVDDETVDEGTQYNKKGEVNF